MSCCDPVVSYRFEDVNGECEKCGEDTVNGESLDQCNYSGVICELCNHAPCDLSC